jgi:hypothetical protein
VNKFSQLTPWVQALVVVAASVTLIAPIHYLKQIILAIAGNIGVAAYLRRLRDSKNRAR